MTLNGIAVGDKVKLETKPNGYLSQHYELTVGKVYEVVGFMGSNIVTTTDSANPDDTASYHYGRVCLVH